MFNLSKKRSHNGILLAKLSLHWGDRQMLRPYQLGQLVLFPQDVLAFLGPKHEAFFIHEAIDELEYLGTENFVAG